MKTKSKVPLSVGIRPSEAGAFEIRAGPLRAARVDLQRVETPSGSFEADAHVGRAESAEDADLDAAPGARGFDQDAQQHGVAGGRVHRRTPESGEKRLSEFRAALCFRDGFLHYIRSRITAVVS
jgi:hypothetical protein